MIKICTIVGARPQFIKLAPVSRALREDGRFSERIIHTGQHYDANMSAVFFEELEIPQPDIDLEIGSGQHGAQTGRMLEAIEADLIEQSPDWVLIYGDTNSTLAGALAAVKLHIPVAHVEAGLRSFNRRMPEEMNRILADHSSELLLTPTKTATDNLSREGIDAVKVSQVGDVMFDAALYFGEKAKVQSQILNVLGLEPNGYVLATVHRAENTDEPDRLREILSGLSEVSKQIDVVMPLHPRTRAALASQGLETSDYGIRFIDPVGYLDMVMLEANSALIATDSGGVQKEAFFYRRPCVTLREETEWTELIDAEWNVLVGAFAAENIRTTVTERIGKDGQDVSPYGRGDSSHEIARELGAR